MCTKDRVLRQKLTALEYEDIWHNSQENANDHKEIPFFTCHSSKGQRYGVGGGVGNKDFHAGWHSPYGGQSANADTKY